MNEAFALLLKSVLAGGIMMGYYYLVLRSRKMHDFNRGYLLLTLLVTMVLPFVHFQLHIRAEESKGLVRVLQVANGGFTEQEQLTLRDTTPSYTDVLPFLYVVISTVLFVLLVFRLRWVLGLRRAGAQVRFDDHTIVFTDNERAPFSFLHFIFWRNDTDMESDAGKLILKHELAHVRQAHTWDKLAVQVALIVAWANPILWLLQRELVLVHEYQADESAIDDGDTSNLAVMILGANAVTGVSPFVNSFSSSIKKRINMLNNKEEVRVKLLRKAVVLPLVVSTLFLFSFSYVTTGVSAAKKKLTLVLDAAHGGKDVGGVANGLTEKELNKRICERLAALAAEYNISIVQTRGGDEYVPLNDRAIMANKIDNALFVQVHVNKTLPDMKVKSGIEVLYSEKGSAGDKNKAFALRVAGRMAQKRPQTVVTQKGIMVLKKVKHPAIAIEFGNIDNPNDMAILLADNRLDELCRDVLSGVVDFGNSNN